MKIRVHCSQCGEVGLDDNMGFWCEECGDCIGNETIISSLMSAVSNLNNRIEIIEDTLRQDGFQDV